MHTGHMRADVAQERFGLDVQARIKDGTLDWTTGGPEGEVYVYESQIREILAEQHAQRWGQPLQPRRAVVTPAAAARKAPAVTTASATSPPARPAAAMATGRAEVDRAVAARVQAARRAAGEYEAMVEQLVALSSLRPSASSPAEGGEVRTVETPQTSATPADVQAAVDALARHSSLSRRSA